jgi:hypothetical protein
MLKKFHWGWGIAIFYTAFAVFILTMVYQSTQHKVELVTPDYYAQELKYQERIDQIENARRLKKPLQWEVQGRQIHLQFPFTGKHVKAKILFYKPDSSAKDVAVECAPDDSGRCIVTSDKLEAGVYQMQIEWQAEQVLYYNEATIRIN